MTAAAGRASPLAPTPLPHSPPLAGPHSGGPARWGGEGDTDNVTALAARLATAHLGLGQGPVGATEAPLLLGLGVDLVGARRFGQPINEVITRVLQRDGKDKASGAAMRTSAHEDRYRLHATTCPGNERLCALDSLLMCIQQGTSIGWTQGALSALPTREDRHKFYATSRDLLRKGGRHDTFFSDWAKAHLGGLAGKPATAITAEQADAALRPLRTCLDKTLRDSTGEAEGLDDLGFAVLAFVLGVDIVRVDLSYTLRQSTASLQHHVSLFTRCSHPSGGAARGPRAKVNLQRPVFLLGVSACDEPRRTRGAPAPPTLVARHVQPILLEALPKNHNMADTTAGWVVGVDVGDIRLHVEGASLSLSRSATPPGPGAAESGNGSPPSPATPSSGCGRYGDQAPQALAAGGPLSNPEWYVRPRHVAADKLPLMLAAPAPGVPPRVGPARGRRNRKGRAGQLAASTLATTLSAPTVAAYLSAIPKRADYLAALMGRTNVPIPSVLVDRKAVGHLLLETLKLVCPPEDDERAKLPRPTTLRKNAVTFFCCVLFPMLLARRPPRHSSPLSGGAAARVTRFLHSPEAATSMIEALLGIGVGPQAAPAPIPRAADTDSPGNQSRGWCVADKIKSLSNSMRRVREQYRAGNESKAYATATRATAPPTPRVDPEDAHAHLQTLHPGCMAADPPTLLSMSFPTTTPAPIEEIAGAAEVDGSDGDNDVESADDPSAASPPHATAGGPGPPGIAAGAGPTPSAVDGRPLGERLDDHPAFPSAELDAVLTDAFLLSALRGMPRGTSPGPFSPTTALLQELVHLGQTEPSLSSLPSRCCVFARHYAQGKVPRLVHELLSESTLLGIPKSDKGVRPIAMGDTWGKWGARCGIVAIRHRIRDILPNFQLGVMVDGGIEAAVLLHRLSLEMRPEDVTLLLDMKNAFNSVSREAVLRAVQRRAPHLMDLATRTLGHRSHLWLHESCRPRSDRPEDRYLLSTEGVRQGDALSPLLFSLVMEDALDELKAALGKDADAALIIAFLDDVSIRAPYHVVRRVLELAPAIFAKYHLILNPSKCVIFETAQARVAADIARRRANQTGPRYRLGLDAHAAALAPTSEEGYELLGTPLGSDEYVLSVLRKKVRDLRGDSEALILLGRNMDEPLMALRLVRSCFAHKIRHLARTVPPHLMAEAGGEFDALVTRTVFGILSESQEDADLDGATELEEMADPTYLDLSAKRFFRAANKGGLGVRSTAVAVKGAYTAGVFQALPVVAHLVAQVPVWKALLPLSADASDDALTRTIASAPCLEHALGAAEWARWRTLAERAGHEVDAALSSSGQVHGAIPADPGSGRRQTTHSSASALVAMSAPQLVRAALAGDLPRKIQHVLTTLEEHERDRLLDEQLLAQALATLTQSKLAWSTSAPLSPALAYLQLQGCSGPGHEWILDTTRRWSKHGGGARHGNPLFHSDAPLGKGEARLALRAHLLLPLEGLYRKAQQEQGNLQLPPRCFCRARCDESRLRLLDAYGFHLMTRVIAAQYTIRHNEYVQALAALLKKAGFRVSIEKHPFREFPDLVDRSYLEESGEGEGARAAAVDRSMRLDIVVEAVPVDLLRRVDPTLVAHLPRGTVNVRTLIDPTFTHPGPYLAAASGLAGKLGLADPVGDRAVENKNGTYLAKTIEAGFALVPFHCNVYGRLHPIASKFLDEVAELAALKSKIGGLGGQPYGSGDRTISYKRALLRNLAVTMRRSTITGWQHATCVARPRFRAGTLASLPLGRPSGPCITAPAAENPWETHDSNYGLPPV